MYVNVGADPTVKTVVQNARTVLIVCAKAVKNLKKQIITVNLPKLDINTYNLIPERNHSVVNQKIRRILQCQLVKTISLEMKTTK